MKAFRCNLRMCFDQDWPILVVILSFSMLASAQNGKDSLGFKIDKKTHKDIHDIPVSYEKSEEILHAGELAHAIENYYVTDDTIFSVADFLTMLTESFPDNDPWVIVRKLKFRLHEHKSYISLKGRIYLKSEFFYTNENQIEKIVINSP